MNDLSPILDDWPFEPGMINVRIIEGLDGTPKIQVRLDLGIIQMNTEGRPDGERPHGFASLLEYHEARYDDLTPALDRDADELDDEDDAFGTGAGDSPGGEPLDRGRDADEAEPLSPEECKALREEAAQYYHRYVALMVLDDFEGVVRDTTRNLRLVALCRERAATRGDRDALEQVRPYIIMMRTRALAGQALKDDAPKAAVFAVDEGLEALRSHFEEMGEPEAFDRSGEAETLRSMRDSLVPKLPVSQKTELRERLKAAVQAENYELAAILRNELRMLGD